MYLGAMGAGVTRYGMVQTNTGKVDSGACYPNCTALTPNNCQPVEFNNVGEFYSYVQAHGENGIILGGAIPDSPQWNAMRDQAFSNCQAAAAVAAAAQVSQPTVSPSPIIQAPGFTAGPMVSVTANPFNPYTPTGVATPTIVTLPGGGGAQLPAGGGAPDGGPSMGFDISAYLPYIAIGGLALILMRRKG